MKKAGLKLFVVTLSVTHTVVSDVWARDEEHAREIGNAGGEVCDGQSVDITDWDVLSVKAEAGQ